MQCTGACLSTPTPGTTKCECSTTVIAVRLASPFNLSYERPFALASASLPKLNVQWRLRVIRWLINVFKGRSKVIVARVEHLPACIAICVSMMINAYTDSDNFACIHSRTHRFNRNRMLASIKPSQQLYCLIKKIWINEKLSAMVNQWVCSACIGYTYYSSDRIMIYIWSKN